MFPSIPTRKMPTTSVTPSLFLPNARRTFTRLPPFRPPVLAQKSTLSISSLSNPPRSPIAHLQPFTTISARWKEARKTDKVKSEAAKIEAGLEKARKKKLEAHPEEVTTTSSMTPLFEGPPKPSSRGGAADEPDMLKGLKSEFRTIKETFALKEVPKEVYYIGLGGVFPYAGISAATLYLAWDINYAHHNGIGYLVSMETAEHILHFSEPVQVGLGAVILSFLGAVHWGLEMAEYGGKHGYRRYALSVLAPVLAWPTILLPFHYALITQFLGFTGMYFADSTVTGWGWAPPWYMTYRFILTLVVGASIVATLIGRGQIGGQVSKAPGPASYLQELRDSQWENLQKEEDERRRKLRQEGAEKKKQKAAKEKPKDDEEEKEEENNETKENEEEDSGDARQSADPGKRAKGDGPGKQGVYSNDKQGATGGKGDKTSTAFEPLEPSGEKKNDVKPAPEGRENTKPRG
ncbi:hypothetical protein L873DRAFT_1667945 [Choiromyces venosus 120613-1]|uniref:Uncharacterized protein n=1 Tax=Choiromyces venosus 120613-1 TaxID=1336337 RepID=A0A3N4JZW7_9PEZI|nr:hypothetical protein L873DRAFT_1667945 [Choiromyces venosus 120613-1]